MKVAKKRKKKAELKRDASYSNPMAPDNADSLTVLETKKLADSGVPFGFEEGEMYRKLDMALGASGRGCSTAEQLRIFKKYVPQLIAKCDSLLIALRASVENQERLHDETMVRSGKRWTESEDEHLIDMAAAGDMTLFELAMTMGRTPGAVQSRISQLVGIGKISQEVAGRFVGTLNGEHVSGIIEGELRKQ